MSKYLDSDGLLYLWQKLKALFAGKVDIETGKGLSSNDYTTAEKQKLAGIAAGADVSTQYFDFQGATAYEAGTTGLVPEPQSADMNKFLKGNGAWDRPREVEVNPRTTQGSLVDKTYLTVASSLGTPTTLGVPYDTDKRAVLNCNTGLLTAVAFSGDGSALTGISASALPAASQSSQGAMSAADKAKLDGFSSASDYALKTDITSMYKHRGTVAAAADLPIENVTAGDVYNVTANGMNYVALFNYKGEVADAAALAAVTEVDEGDVYKLAGTDDYRIYVDSTAGWASFTLSAGWDALGEVFSMDAITNTEIDTILAS